MNGRRLKKHERELVKEARKLGYEIAGFTGSTQDHVILEHTTTGAKTTISSSPSGFCNKKALAQLRRLASGGTR